MSSGCAATLAGGGWSPEEMVTKAIRPAIFKWRHTEPELILCAVRWYLRYSLSFRDVEELLSERGLEVDHTTIWRWVQRDGPELEERLRRHLKTINRFWRVDETDVRVKGRWCYLYRALDSTGATIDFVLSGRRDAAAATRLFRKALTDPAHPQPRVINTDQARLYGSAIAGMKKEGILRRRCRHRPVQALVHGSRALGERRWCADSARWASSGRHVDHRDRRRVMISM